ncbi:MAG: hypothetical protein FWF63_02730 [Fibromonadales bacterium]|nr:hypothetical protein [Fibromonadales bacterium]
MKRLLLLFALECHALMLPSLNNSAIWNVQDILEVEKAKTIAFRYSEPFYDFQNAKLDIVWSDGSFLAAVGFGSAVLDSIYKELEFSGSIAFKPFNFLSFNIAENANISWIPENASWQEHNIFAGASFFYKDWAKISGFQKTSLASKTPIAISWFFICETNFSSHYSFGAELPINSQNEADFRFFQKINLGYFTIYNSFAYPGPVLGFGFILSTSHFAAGAGHLRGSYPNGHTGYMIKWQGQD